MSNLKFKDIRYIDKGKQKLMAVILEKDNKEYKWFPRWEDIGHIFYSSWSTEHKFNNRAMNEFFMFVCLDMLTRNLLLDKYKKEDSKHIKKLDELFASVMTELLDKE